MGSPKALSLFILVFGSLVLATAWAFQIVGGFQPCGLCLQQRIPYYAGLPVAAVAVLIAVKFGQHKVVRLALWLVALIFAWGVFLAVQHAGVEWGWWLGPANCGAGDLTGLESGGSLLKSLQTTTVAYCDQPAGRFLGLSFAGWNAVASIILTAAALRGASSRG